MASFVEALIGGILEIIIDSSPKAKNVAKSMCDDYNKKASNVKKEYNTTTNKAHNMSNSQLKNSYRNASNDIQKSAYAKEIKNRINTEKANEPKYKPIDGYKSNN